MKQKERNKAKEKIPGQEAQFITKHFALLLSCLFITFLCYLPSITNGWTHWDDNLYVYDNVLTKSLSFSSLPAFFTSWQMGNYHPLTMLSLALDYRLFGMNAAAFHFHNILLHLLNVGLLFLFIWMLTRKLWVCVFTALLFGIHPAHVESVSWITERKDLLYVFYFIAALIAYLKYRETGNKSRWYFITVLLFIFSLLSKGQAVTFPLALLLVDYFRAGRINRKAWLEKAPFFILAVTFGIAAIYAQHSANAIMDIAHYSFPQRILFASYSLLTYLVKAFLPLNLSAYYAYPNPAQAGYDLLFCIAPFGVLLLFAAVIYAVMKKNRVIAFGFGFFLLNMALVLQILPIGGAMMADRYTYLSYIGLFFIMGMGLDYIIVNVSPGISKWKYPTLAVTFGLTIFLCTKTVARQAVWKSDRTLFSDMLLSSPDVPVVNNNMGNACRQDGETELAIKYFSKVISLEPDFGDAYTNRGESYLSLGKPDEAISDLNLAIQYHPSDIKNYTLRGEAYKMKGKPEQVVNDLLKALAINSPDKLTVSDIYVNLGDAYNSLKQFSSSDSCYELALSINPMNIMGLNNYACNLSERNGKPDKAEAMAQQAISMDETNGNSMDTYGQILYKQGKYTDAKRWTEKAIMNGMENNNQVLEHYGDVLYRTGDTAGALHYWQKAKDKGPSSDALENKIKERKLN